MKHIPLIFILFVAGLLRIIQLGSIPSGFHSDEVMNGYVGRFTLQNGVDLYGNTLPFLYFDNFGDFPNILPMYLSGLSTYVFGVNEFAVRFPIALAGILTVLIVYKLALLFTKNQTYGLVTAAVLAITPWHIVLSRATAEGVTATMVFLLGLWCLFVAFKTKSWWKLLSAYLLLGLTYFLYPSYRILVPAALLPTLFFVAKKYLKVIALVMAGIFFGLTLLISQTVWGKGRYDQTSIFAFNDVLAIRQAQAVLADRIASPLISKAFHNQYWIALREIANQYAHYWSPSFLIIRGGLPPRYQLPDQGLFYGTLVVVCFVASLVYVIKKRQLRWSAYGLYGIYLLLLSPLPAALTMEDTPNVHRAVLMGVLLVFGFGAAITHLIQQQFVGKRLVVVGLGLMLCFEGSYFWHVYSVDSTVTQAVARHNEMKDVSYYLIQHASEYDVVYAPTIAHLPLHYLFHAGIFDRDLAGKFKADSVIDRVGNIHFFPDQCPSGFLPSLQQTGKVLIIDRAECTLDANMKTIETIKRADDFPAYYIRTFER